MTAARGQPGPLAVVARTTLLVSALAAVAIFHVWCHTRVTAAGYRLGELQRARESLRNERNRLEVEVATLRAPGRLEGFARARLGMAPPAPGAVVAGGQGEAAAGRAGMVGDGNSHRPAPAEPVERQQRVAEASGSAPEEIHVASWLQVSPSPRSERADRERPPRGSAQ